MKNYLLALSILSFTVLVGCSAGYVTERPSEVVYTRPVSPGVGYVWINGEWEYSGHNYHWREGSWQKPREGHTWKPGYWENNEKGYRWHKGEWQR
ncbi:MAG TPA: hypothetical protein VFE04_08315 [Puia sp.]|nr:hypothetical protein [Puia sp.]